LVNCRVRITVQIGLSPGQASASPVLGRELRAYGSSYSVRCGWDHRVRHSEASVTPRYFLNDSAVFSPLESATQLAFAGACLQSLTFVQSGLRGP
jgi:hypothetical protein